MGPSFFEILHVSQRSLILSRDYHHRQAAKASALASLPYISEARKKEFRETQKQEETAARRYAACTADPLPLRLLACLLVK